MLQGWLYPNGGNDAQWKNQNPMNDRSLMEWYMKGFFDELNGSSSVESDYPLENKAYKLGADHAVFGDEAKSLDSLTKEEILALIKG